MQATLHCVQADFLSDSAVLLRFAVGGQVSGHAYPGKPKMLATTSDWVIVTLTCSFRPGWHAAEERERRHSISSRSDFRVHRRSLKTIGGP